MARPWSADASDSRGFRPAGAFRAVGSGLFGNQETTLEQPAAVQKNTAGFDGANHCIREQDKTALSSCGNESFHEWNYSEDTRNALIYQSVPAAHARDTQSAAGFDGANHCIREQDKTTLVLRQ